MSTGTRINSHPAACRRTQRGFSLIEIIIVIAVIVVLFAILNSAMTGGSGKGPGVKEQADRTIASINLHNVYQGFFVWAQSHDEKYPSTRVVRTMQSDTTHDVFRVLLEDGVIAGQQLQSPNEIETGFEVGYADNFGPKNTSYALNNYDADDWVRERNWNSYQNGSFVLLSDRWVDIQGYQYHTINESFWYALFNDGHGDNIQTGRLRNGDDLFTDEAGQYGAEDAFMVHD